MSAVQTGSEIFEQRWSTYDRILAGNHLFHRELYQELRRFLRSTFQSAPIAVLDLGCGDCRYLSQQLIEYPDVCRISRFVGVDLASAALDAARKNIAAALPEASSNFVNSDIVEFTASCGERFDLAFASYSVHHLTLGQKDQLVKHLAGVLKPGGVYFQVDVLRRPNEDLSAYRERFERHIKADWNYLTPEGKEDIAKHARECDLPETLDTWRSMALRHGFSNCTVIGPHPHPDTGFCLVLQK